MKLSDPHKLPEMEFSIFEGQILMYEVKITQNPNRRPPVEGAWIKTDCFMSLEDME